MSEAPKAIFIDWDGTLSQSRFWQAWCDDYTDSEKYQAIERVLFARPNDLLQNWMLGKFSAEQVVEQVAGQANLQAELCLDALRSSCEAMKVEPGALEAVEKLRAAGRLVFIATDNMDTFTRWTVPALGLGKIFDGILNSAELGVFKKDIDDASNSRFFAETFHRFNIDPHQTLLIDDSNNSRVVEEFGMNFQKVAKPSETVTTLESILLG